MKKLHFIVALTTHDNDYQLEQAAAAEETAHRLGVSVKILYADNDAVTQSQQLLQAIQSSAVSRPDAIIFEPVGGTALPQVARAAAAAGIGWAVLNREVEDIADLRRAHKAPVFMLSSDHEEIGRIQGRQFAALLPAGGTVLYIQGPSESSAAKQRTTGMMETKPANIQVTTLKAQWTEASARHAVSSWLRLSTSTKAHVDLIGAQDDSMAMGARKAFEQQTTGAERERCLKLPFTGCDGLPKTGQTWVRTGLLAATVIVPPNTSLALEMLVPALLTGSELPARASTVPVPYPALDVLAKMKPHTPKSHGAAHAGSKPKKG